LFCVFLVTFILVSVYSCLRNTARKYTETSSAWQIDGLCACCVAERHII